ncbi:RNA polymerase sigma-70 factor [Labilithrix luteola]|nr:RNA polymerase sigma-70 factor [Labilithrix luteola]
MNRTDSFQSYRPLLFAIGYRMLGSAAEAEDVLQDAWLRWEAADPAEIESEKAWLSTVVTRLCLDRLKSARMTREQYVGPWLPEPVKTEVRIDPDSISMAFLVLLERLTPVERAAFLLHEVFEYSHGEVAAMLGEQEATCRQFFHRAQARIREGRPRFSPSRADHERLLRTFAEALMKGDLDVLEKTLSEDATLWADSGGKVRAAARRPVHGAHAIALFFAGVVRKFPHGPDQSFEILDVNGWPAVVGRSNGIANLVLSIETDGEKITAVRNVVNPEKLRRV